MSANTVRLIDGGSLAFQCPGCREAHVVNVGAESRPRWRWNSNEIRPTLDPSILVRSGHFVPGHRPGLDTCWCDYNRAHPDEPAPFSCGVCHSFVREGLIQFLPDCTHALAGQTVALPPWGS
jgi:hypothetical protein